MKRSQQIVIGVLAFLMIVVPAAAGYRSTVRVKNLSDWTIMEFYMSPYDDDDWGEDLLGRDILEPGDTLTLTNISCDEWDIMFVDEDEDECVLEAVDLCGDRAHWNITNRELLSCIDE